MAHDDSKELVQLKQEVYQLELQLNEEKQGIKHLIHTFSRIFGTDFKIKEMIDEINQIVSSGKSLNDKSVDQLLAHLKNRVLSQDSQPDGQEPEISKMSSLIEQLSEKIKKLISISVNEFYPLNDKLLVRAHELKAQIDNSWDQSNLEKSVKGLIDYFEGLKIKINSDYRKVNNDVYSLINQFKELENLFVCELSPNENLEQITRFEEQVSGEFDSLFDSLDPAASINDVKKLLGEKINTLKSTLSGWKDREQQKVKTYQQQIHKLKCQLAEVEQDAKTLSKLARKFKSESSIDKLTHLFNRSAFDTKLAGNLKKFHEQRKPFALILFDIDHFKAINDTFGHIGGDTVLKGIADCLKESFRANDFLARLGGDEFVAIIDGFTNEMAETRIDLFRENLKKRKFKSRKKGEITVTVSAGVAVPRKNDTCEDILERADKAMYLDKKR